MIGLLKMSLSISQSRLKEIRNALPVILWVRWGNRTRISTLFSLGAVIRKRSLCPWDPCISGASVDPRRTRCAYICEFSINWPVFTLFVALFVKTDTSLSPHTPPRSYGTLWRLTSRSFPFASSHNSSLGRLRVGAPSENLLLLRRRFFPSLNYVCDAG